jgi:hypothetical protein
MKTLDPRLQSLFTRCLREGVYPRAWGTARLILLSKEGRPLDSPSAYRPICLLDEVGKLFERIIAARLEAHMMERAPGWHDSQFGFRRGGEAGESNDGSHGLPERSGANGLPGRHKRLQYHTIPWDGIMEALERFRVPPYLVRLIRSYLNDRWIAYTGRNGEEKRPVECGVPQGSVLGPIMWIMTYDSVLQCPMSPDTDMVRLVLGPSRGLRVVRDTEARGDRRGMGSARHPETGPECVADQVRGTGVLRPSH